MPPAAPPTVTEVYAPLLVGAFLSTMLYGVVLVQAYIYFQTSSGDRTWMRLLVLYLFIAETANTTFDIGIVFEPLLLKFGKNMLSRVTIFLAWVLNDELAGNQDVIVTSPLFLRADGVVTTLISTPVQMFMAWRIRVVTQTIIPSIIIVILSLGSLAGGIFLAVSVSHQPQFAKFDDFRAAPALWLVTSAVADVVITGCLVYGLVKKKTGFTVLNDQIDRIIRLTIQTGTLTAVAALADAIVFLSVADTTIFFSWDLTLAKLYTISLLSSLNARNDLRNRDNTQHAGTNPLFGTSELVSRSSNTTTGTSSRMVQGFNSRAEAIEMTPRVVLNPRTRGDSLRAEVPGRLPMNISISKEITMDDMLEDMEDTPRTKSQPF